MFHIDIAVLRAGLIRFIEMWYLLSFINKLFWLIVIKETSSIFFLFKDIEFFYWDNITVDLMKLELIIKINMIRLVSSYVVFFSEGIRVSVKKPILVRSNNNGADQDQSAHSHKLVIAFCIRSIESVKA